ncbi:efflux RND transporter periplasmic adaptor subunit [Salinispira pacifica]
MRKRFAVSLVVGFILVAAAGFLAWRNLSGTIAPNAPLAAGQRARPGSGGPPGGPGGPSGPPPADGQAAGARNGRSQSHPVKTDTAQIGTLQTYVKLTGEVSAATTVNVFPEVVGKVDQINVNVGTRVDAQTVVVTVDPSRPGTRYESNPVRSPIAGTVTDILVKRGQTVTTATPMLTVATVGDLELVVRVPERYASAVSRAAVGKVHFDAPGDRTFEARVKRFQPVIDPVSRSKEVVFGIPYGTAGIEPGMFASVELVTQRIPDAVIVPFETIVQEADSNYVFTAENGRAVKRSVEVGLLSGEMIQIRSGLKGGESVVTSGQGFLESGSPITVVGETAGRVQPAQARQ